MLRDRAVRAAAESSSGIAVQLHMRPAGPPRLEKLMAMFS